jgi:diguanylate cyclase (GGDEF)-like protein
VFGSEPQVRKPVLLLLVFGVLLVLVGITATAQAVMVSAYASTSTFSSIVDSDVATIRGFVHEGLDGFDPANPDPGVLRRIDAQLGTLLAKGGIAHAEIRAVDGRVIASSSPASVGSVAALSADFAAALSGTPRVAVVDAADAESGAVGLPATVLREYLPLREGDRTILVMAIWRDAVPVLSQLDGLRRDVVVVTLSAALIAAFVLILVFRSAQATIHRQTGALLDAINVDPLTGTLNHGALVAHLARDIERARAADAPLGVALIDLDNFRLLNDNHGHVAGDEVLLAVAEAVRIHLPAGAVMGRYGPDEFLIITHAESVVDLETGVERARTSLADVSLQFETTERLPVTVSAGICTFPDHGTSVTELLAAAAATLQEARVSGGDAVRVAGTEAAPRPAGAATFDVLQGLVFAVDTKDRYTKRHSEGVARYGVFLAGRLGLEPATIDAIHMAGLLHDIGKIGIPDAILRKPARLTAEEYEVVKQHVALGDMIVRDLPDVDAVRAGIRHHHERWDGTGYLHALRGEDIPFVARILAVADAFSAMTTTRPYRKALDVREALSRLGDSAGKQLDETLVATFILGIETAPDAPLPGDGPTAAFWTPGRRVA